MSLTQNFVEFPRGDISWRHREGFGSGGRFRLVDPQQGTAESGGASTDGGSALFGVGDNREGVLGGLWSAPEHVTIGIVPVILFVRGYLLSVHNKNTSH